MALFGLELCDGTMRGWAISSLGAEKRTLNTREPHAQHDPRWKLMYLDAVINPHECFFLNSNTLCPLYRHTRCGAPMMDLFVFSFMVKPT